MIRNSLTKPNTLIKNINTTRLIGNFNSKLETLYREIKRHHFEKHGEEILSGPTWNLKGEHLYKKENDKLNLKQTVPSLRDQGAIAHGDEMKFIVLKEVVSDFKGNNAAPYFGYVTMNHQDQSQLFFQTPNERTPLNNFSNEKLQEILGEKGFEKFQEYTAELSGKSR